MHEPFLWSFLFFFLFASMVLSNRSWRTNRNFTPILSLASLSSYANFINKISFFNLASAFIPVNFHVARVNFVLEVSECENCLTFDTGGLLAFTELFSGQKQHRLVCTTFADQISLFIFWKGPSFLSLCLWYCDSEPDSEVYQQRQIK